MFRTTIHIPLGSESGKCTIELPMSAFEDGQGDEASEERIAAFSSKITAAVLKTAREMTAFKNAAKRAREEEAVSQTPRRIVKKERLDTIPNDLETQGTGTVAPPVKQDMIEIVLHDWEMSFPIRLARTTRLSRAFAAFCSVKGRSISTLRFLYETQRIQGHETPESVSLVSEFLHAEENQANSVQLEMEDGDVIYVHTEQRGS